VKWPLLNFTGQAKGREHREIAESKESRA